MERIFLSPPYLNGQEEAYIKEALEANWIAPVGPHVNLFEKEIREYVGAQGAVALSSGTAAIHLCLKRLEVGEGDYVICSSFTFAGSCNPILYQGAHPIFVDSEPDSWNMSSKALQKALDWCGQNGIVPKAAIIVNLYGQSADMDALLPIFKQYGIPVIEDAAESLGATYGGKMSGTFGDFGVFSFNGNKIITTSGGGMAVSDDMEAINKMRFWATQSREPYLYYQHEEVGYNYRMSNICAGIGRAQLLDIGERISHRKTVFERYRDAFADLPVDMMPILSKGAPNYWLAGFTIRDGVDITPEMLIVALERHSIESRHFWKPMQLQPLYHDCPFFSHLGQESCSVSGELFRRGLCLPSGSAMTEEQQDRVIHVVLDTFAEITRHGQAGVSL